MTVPSPTDGDRAAPAEPRAGDPPPGRERRAAFLVHAAALLLFFLPLGNLAGPLLAYVLFGRGSLFAANHMRQALLFQTAVSALAWGFFLHATSTGGDLDLHYGVLLGSIPLFFYAAIRAGRGKWTAFF